MTANFFSNIRRKSKSQSKAAHRDSAQDFRAEFERDYDRILFSTPVRRMADKTQVFPLEKNDSVRTRLTHSHEVATLARSLGYAVLEKGLFGEKLERTVPPILATVGLAHDLGNPPFGHSGESAIQHWFKINSAKIFTDPTLTDAQKNDFLKFEGNAQTLRLVTKLQILNDDFGLDLTLSTLAALVKYPVGSDKIDKNIKIHKKHGFFQSEKSIVDEVWTSLNMKPGQRHPLAFLMEACDDIAYLVLDAEDAVKKGLASFNDLLSYLELDKKDDPVINSIVTNSRAKYKEYAAMKLSPKELNDISMQRLRVFAITAFIDATQNTFFENFNDIIAGTFNEPLLDKSAACHLADALRDFDINHAYRAPQVLLLESQGFNVINELMDMLWIGITDRKDNNDVSSKRLKPFSILAYSLISENYRRVYASPTNKEPVQYKDAQLLTDMISGMTDQFALDLHKTLKGHK